MLDSMTLREFAEWEAFDRVEPIGTRPVTQSLSLIGSVVASAAGGKVKPHEFTPWATKDETPEVVSAADIKAAFQQVTGGR